MKQKKKPAFNKQERAILQVLYRERRPMSIRELAEKTGLSWVTCRKYIRKLKERDWVHAEQIVTKKGENHGPIQR